jgi:uracil-DNA glycosylase
MIWDKFKDMFHESWHDKMRPFIESKECDDIYAYLKSESQRGKQIAPLSHNVFRCFKETPYTDLKVVFIGLCPYHTAYNGVPIADGLMMGCSTTGRLQPSLEQLYGGIEKDIYGGLALGYSKVADVSYLAHQGVLMCNAALTTEINKAGSHLHIWEPFMKYLLGEVLAFHNAPVVFFGKEAGKLKRYMSPMTYSYIVSHPASASYKNTDWDPEGVFNKINLHTDAPNGFPIEWLKFPTT